MTQQCYSAGCISVGRVAIVDACTGEFSTGPNSQYVFGGVVTVTWEPVIEDGETTTVKDMCGDICVRDLQCDQTVGYNVEITLCRPDNELVSLLTGEPAILDVDGNTIGYFELDDSNCAPFVSLEFFEKLPESACTDGVQYRRIIFPKIRITQGAPERQGPIRLLKLTGTAEAGSGDAWGTGPAGDSPVDFDLLMTSDQKFFMSEVYDSTAPDPACGYTSTSILGTLTSPSECVIHIDGPGLSTTQMLQFTTPDGTIQIFSPTNVNFPSNPPGTVINQWDDAGIDVYSPDLCGICIDQLDFFQADNDTFSIPSQLYDPCFQVQDMNLVYTSSESPACETIRINGEGFSVVDSVEVIGSGNITYYDPAGPNAGSNPGGATILSWTPTTLTIQDPNLASLDPITDLSFFNTVPVDILDATVTDVFDIDPCVVPRAGYRETDTNQASASNTGTSITYDVSGNYYVASTVDVAGQQGIGVYKYDSNGDLDITFGTAGLASFKLNSTYDYADAVVWDSAGFVYLSGWTTDFVTSNAVIVKIDDSVGALDLTWMDAFVAIPGYSYSLPGAFSHDLAVSSGKLFIETTGKVVYAVNDPISSNGGGMVRLDTAGNFDSYGDTFWAPYSGTDIPAVFGMQQVSDGIYVIGLENQFNTDVLISLFDFSSGVTAETLVSGVKHVSAHVPVEIDSFGNYYIAGGQGSNPGDNSVVARFTPLLVLDATWGVAGYANNLDASFDHEFIQGLEVLASGEIAAVGGAVALTTEPKSIVRKLDSSGASVGAFGTAGLTILDIDLGFGGERLSSVAESPIGSIAASGTILNGVTYQSVIARFDSTTGALDNTFGQ